MLLKRSESIRYKLSLKVTELTLNNPPHALPQSFFSYLLSFFESQKKFYIENI